MPRIIKPAVGSFTASNITVDSSGRIVAASSGSGAANMLRTFTSKDDGTATFTAQPGTSKIHVYLRGAGGGGGGGSSGGQSGGSGGHGGFGFFNIPVSQPYSVPFTLGAGGSGGLTIYPLGAQAGTAGAASSFNTNLVANGGNGGTHTNGVQAHGNNGTTQNADFSYINATDYAVANSKLFTPEGMVSVADENGGTQTYNNSPQYGTPDPSAMSIRTGGMGGAFGTGMQTTTRRSGTAGQDGSIVVYEDIG
jgi:hypothetical protein